MNRFLLTCIIKLIFIFSISTQVSSVKYNISFNDTGNTYDCSMIVINGFAESADDRKLINAKFSFKVESGSQLKIDQNYAPYIGNEFLDGFSPVLWTVKDMVSSPASDPGFDYYSIVPDLEEDSRFFNLYNNNIVALFSISVKGSCEDGVQIYENGVDPGPFSAGMNGVDFTNSISIGNSGDQFSGLNKDIAYNRFITLNEAFACEGACVTITPESPCDLSNLTILWSDDSTEESITICPDGETPVSLQAVDDFGDVHIAETVVQVIIQEHIDFNIDSLCLNGPQEYFAYSSNSMNEIWESLNTSVATISENGEITTVSSGSVTFRLTDSITGCSIVSEPLIIMDKPKVIAVDGLHMKVGQSLQFLTDQYIVENGFWQPYLSDIGVINDGKLYGLKPGIIEVYYIELTNYECLSDTVEVIIEENESCNDEGSIVWQTVQLGAFDTNVNMSAYASSDKFYSNDDRHHLVGYDQNTGDLWLKQMDNQGTLLEEFKISNNPQHDEDGDYELELHDLDLDGLMDIVLIGSRISTGNTITVFRNLDGGNFSLAYNVVSCNQSIRQLIDVHDYDNDGFLDIYSSCRDDYYQVIYNNNWSEFVEEASEGTNDGFFSMDYDGDGDLDIIYQNVGLLINQGDRSFIYDGSLNANLIRSDRLRYDESLNLVIGNRSINKIENLETLKFNECARFEINDSYSDNSNFIAKFNNSTDTDLAIVGTCGVAILPLDFNCENIDDGFEYYNFNVVAGKYTQIDIGDDGLTDFFYVEGNNIYASVNPNSDNSIKGFSYIDGNENGIFDQGETPLRNVLVGVDQTNTKVLTDEEGRYTLLPPDSPYVLSASVLVGGWIESSLQLNSDLVGDACYDNNNFGFVLSGETQVTGQISITNSIARCDFETRFYLTVENQGAEDSEFSLQFDFDNETTFFSSEIPDYTINGNTLEADLGMLKPFEPTTYLITLKMPSGSSSLPLLSFNGRISNSSIMLDEFFYEDQLRCSYDPNDKQVVPNREGDENFTLFEEDLTYTIRFQNNGNDTAFSVKIIDPLHPAIDKSSIRVLDTSHEVRTSIESDNLVFFFPEINLVDSTTNYVLSQGYVLFECNTINGLAENTLIENTADIIFDTNTPILTNTTVNTMVSIICTPITEEVNMTICEDESFLGFDETGTYNIELLTNEGCDSIITLNLIVEDIKTDSIFVTVCENENFLGFDETGTYNIELLTNEGCDSIITLNLIVEDIKTDWIVISACENEVVDVLGIPMTFDSSIQYIDTVQVLNETCSYELIEVIVEVILRQSSAIDTTICEGQSFLGYTETGVYAMDSINPQTGCIVDAQLNLTVLPITDPNCLVSANDIEKISLTLYPNPAGEYFSFESEHTVISIKIYDVNKRLIMNQSVEDNHGTINSSLMYPGIYIVQFETKNSHILYRRLIIE